MSNLALQTGCYAYDPTIETQYDYVPSRAASITFLSLFGISLALHIVQTTWTRTWWGYVSLSCPDEKLAHYLGKLRKKSGLRCGSLDGSDRLGRPNVEFCLPVQ